MNGVFHRLYYALTEYKRKGETTLILGAGCSLSSTIKDVSTIGIMKESLYEHNIAIDDEKNWEDIYIVILLMLCGVVKLKGNKENY